MEYFYIDLKHHIGLNRKWKVNLSELLQLRLSDEPLTKTKIEYVPISFKIHSKSGFRWRGGEGTE